MTMFYIPFILLADQARYDELNGLKFVEGKWRQCVIENIATAIIESNHNFLLIVLIGIQNIHQRSCNVAPVTQGTQLSIELFRTHIEKRIVSSCWCMCN